MKISPDSYSNYLNPGLDVLKIPNTSGDWEEEMTAPHPPTYKGAVFVEDNFALS